MRLNREQTDALMAFIGALSTFLTSLRDGDIDLPPAVLDKLAAVGEHSDALADLL